MEDMSLISPEKVALKYGGNKQKIADAMRMNLVHPTVGLMAGLFIDRMRNAEAEEQKVNTTCQFSWVCQPFFTSKLLTMKHTSLYNDVLNLSIDIFLNYDRLVDVTEGATYYHADYVNPGWKLPKTAVIGRHIFYKKPGDLDNKKEFSGI